MASIVLKTFKGGNVTPLNDAIIFQTAIPGAGIFKGCEVTVARGNILHISQGYGIIKGRFFEMYENEVSVQLAETGQTLNGRLYLHMDLSNADEPIKIMTETAEQLSNLLMDANVNYNNSAYDLELAVFKVDAAGVINLTQTFPTVQAGSGGGGGNGSAGIMRDTAYEEGDIVTCANAPGWCILVCTQRGATAIAEPVGYTQIQKGGDRVLDGTCVFMARDLIAELDNITLLQDDVTEIAGELAEMKSDTDSVNIKVMTLDAYKALSEYSSRTLYYCYKDANSQEIIAIYLGQNAVYSTGVTAVYHIDEESTTTKTFSIGDDAVALAPAVNLPGYTFVGWREDNKANKTVLSEKTVTSDVTINLYAVFAEPVTISFDANGGTGEIEDMNGGSYYNNGNVSGASVKLPKRGFTRTGYQLVYWLKGSTSGAPCAKGASVPVSSDTTFYAMWVKEKYEFEFKGETEDFNTPVDGIYKITAYGPQGGSCIDNNTDEVLARGGLGGMSYGFLNLKKNTSLIICVGGKGGDGKGTSGVIYGGYNGGGNSYVGSSYIGAAGGGCTHVASIGNTLTAIGKAKIANVYLVAGGGGGASYTVTGKVKVDGGYGGGTYGGNGKVGTGGSNTAGYGGDPTTFTSSNAKVGYGVSTSSSSSGGYGGGGSGYIGGNCGGISVGGGGGCGFIDNIPEIEYDGETYTPMTQGNVNEGDGKVEIELVKAIVR